MFSLKYMRIEFFCLCIAFFTAWACGSNTGGKDECSEASDCDTGICVDGACVPDTGDSASDDSDNDTGIDSSEDTGSDSATAGTDDSDSVPLTNPPLADYVPCDQDADCQGRGICVTEVTLSGTNSDGDTTVSLLRLFPSLFRQGVCSAVCTENESICDTLTVTDFRGVAQPFVCQLVVSDDGPYPTGAAFPFADQLDTEAMVQGTVFGAICRPPVEVAEDIPSTFCASCADSTECDDGICWKLGDEQSPEGWEQGTCLSACTDSTMCPMGFTCETVGGSEETYCRPRENTCSSCRDIDGDGYGVGHCNTKDGSVTPVDCDDLNVLAYFDPDDMTHSFPAYCGDFDYNCNGVADAEEQIGADVYPEEHCGACYATCIGSFSGENDFGTASNACVNGVDGAQCEVQCEDDLTYVDCDGSLHNGCETVIADRTSFQDLDEDGYGDVFNSYFACDGTVPDGYVTNALDCDDSNVEMEGQSCDTGSLGICGPGKWACVMEGDVTLLECQSNFAAATTDGCNGNDDNCDGDIDEDFTASACTIPSEVGECVNGMDVCENGTIICESQGPTAEIAGDGIDNDCDGFDGTITSGVFVAPGPADTGSGTMDDPFTSLKEAVELAIARAADVYIAIGTIEIDENIQLKNGVGIYGGYDRYAEEPWSLIFESDTEGNTEVVSRSSLLATSTDSNGDDSIIAFDGANIFSETWLKNLDLHMTSPAGAGVSLYGLRCEACDALRLENMSIYMAKASDGADYAVSGGNSHSGIFDTVTSTWVNGDGASGESGGSSIGMLLFGHSKTIFTVNAGVAGASNVTISLAKAGDGGENGGSAGDSYGVLYDGNIAKTGILPIINNNILAASGDAPGVDGEVLDWKSFAKCVVYVNDDAAGSGDGSSFENAYTNLQQAIDVAAAGNDENTRCDVWVAAGTYLPGASRTDTFTLTGGVHVYGGFAGTETSTAARADMLANASVLSGDLNGDDVQDDFESGKTDNSYTIVTGENGAILDGFTIVGGHAEADSASENGAGAGLFSANKTLTVRNCVFTNNYANFGAAAYLYGSTVAMHNCLFYDNRSITAGGAVFAYDSVVDLVHCTVVDNTVDSGVGAAAAMQGGGTFSIANTIITSLGTATLLDGDYDVTYSLVTDEAIDGEGVNHSSPGFINRSANNFNLKADSVCVDAGNWGTTVMTGLTFDIEGGDRYVGDQVDIGAYELAGVEDSAPSVAAVAYLNLNTVVVDFDEPMNADTIAATVNYEISGDIEIYSAQPSNDGKSVTLQISELTLCENYTAFVSAAVTDLNGNTMESDAVAELNVTTLSESFAVSGAAYWDAVDFGDLAGPSVWTVSNDVLTQTSEIYSTESNFPRLGTVAVFNASSAANLTDYSFSALFRSGDEDGVGIVFRYVDSANYYKLELSGNASLNFIRLSKVEDGVETELASDENGGLPPFPLNDWFELGVVVEGDAISVYMDAEPLFEVITDDANSTGSFGIYAWNNPLLEVDSISANFYCE
ncbi:MAG: Ig-like domain-containing protein [Deltaproteobacteria bacterium]|nr:Ig-like domain-containing protein [Deltaproteobacteria bacterium]MBN2672240.1 Ig-like domain-containing protein [Deltaproteobacteria bacterium]